jgi:FkbM family methyltransferase
MRHPIKKDCLDKIKQLNIPILAIVDVGVLDSTPELISAFPNLTHYLFEPIVEWEKYIKINYKDIDYQLFQVALTDVDGPLQMVIHSVIDGLEISHARILNESVDVHGQLRSIEGRRLDSIVNTIEIPFPFLLKIDVDGAEINIIDGASKILDKVSVLVVEAGIDNFLDRANRLSGYGFELFDIVDLSYYEDRLAQFDFVFLNKNLKNNLRLNLFESGPFNFNNWVNYKGGI